MNRYHVPVRETYRLPPTNSDDFYSNGNAYDGPRLFRITVEEREGFAISGANQAYEVANPSDLAWDAFFVNVPKRLVDEGRADDVIVHECVHFLQKQTRQEEANYFNWDGTTVGWLRYVSQRVELEAHFIQIAFLLSNCMPYVQLKATPNQHRAIADAVQRIEFAATGLSIAAISAIALSKQIELI